MKPTIGRIVIYRTDGRNGLVYDLPAIITVTEETHPGDYPDGSENPLPVLETDHHVHLTVFTPGGFGTTVRQAEIVVPDAVVEQDSSIFKDSSITPGSGTYVEWNVPYFDASLEQEIPSRSWRWPTRV